MNSQRLRISIQVGEGDGMYRMHIHVPLESRYQPIDQALLIQDHPKSHDGKPCRTNGRKAQQS